MLRSILKNWDKLNEDNQLHKIIDLRKAHIEKLVNFLVLFEEATEEIEGQRYPTLNLDWPWHKKLSKHLLPQHDDCNMMKTMKLSAHNYITQKFELHEYHKLAVFLHPILKGLKIFANYQEKSDIHSHAKALYIKYKVSKGADDIQVTVTVTS